MTWLATWFIYELIRLVAVPNLNEPQAFKNVFLQNDNRLNIHFLSYVFLKIAPIQVLTFDMNGQSGSGSGNLLQLPLPRKFSASASASLLLTKLTW